MIFPFAGTLLGWKGKVHPFKEVVLFSVLKLPLTLSHLHVKNLSHFSLLLQSQNNVHSQTKEVEKVKKRIIHYWYYFPLHERKCLYLLCPVLTIVTL